MWCIREGEVTNKWSHCDHATYARTSARTEKRCAAYNNVTYWMLFVTTSLVSVTCIHVRRHNVSEQFMTLTSSVDVCRKYDVTSLIKRCDVSANYKHRVPLGGIMESVGKTN